MDTGKLSLLVHTLKYLRLKQVFYRGYYLLRNRLFNKNYKKALTKEIGPLNWQNTIYYTDSYKNNKTFEFLNLKHCFTAEINWNHNAFGKLWTYNLNYFDFLNQAELSVDDGLELMAHYVENEASLIDGKEPYTISLRGINWIKFVSQHSISDRAIDQTLYTHYRRLSHNLEYHLLGNHLLENGFSLLFGAYYFKEEVFYAKAKKILRAELAEQILSDGAHFELSPMYHQILLHRLLDCINLVRRNSWKSDDLGLFLEEKALKMLSWLEAVTFSNGSIPMVNDSAHGIAPTSGQLFDYAKTLGLQWPKTKLSDSGYRKFKHTDYELFVDVGQVGPSYQPGHAHSDTFNFVLYTDQQPLLVDTGTSTYEKNALRQHERETAAHNTVKIGHKEQTQVWGGFRVAKRANTRLLEESESRVKAVHDGYRSQGIDHTRTFSATANEIVIEDTLSKEITAEQQAFFHFHPSVTQVEIDANMVALPERKVRISFDGALAIRLLDYEYADGFNLRRKAQKIAVSFQKTLTTRIAL